MSVDAETFIGPRTLETTEFLSRSERQADLAGAFSSGGGYCPEGIPVETAIFAILGAFGVAFGILFRAVTAITGGRRKRDTEPNSVWEEVGNHVADLFWWGNINFNGFSAVLAVFSGTLE